MTRKAQALGQLESSVRGAVLAVDTATRSGWAIRVGHRLTHSGESNTLDADGLDRVCALALRVAGEHRVTAPALVLERPWGGLAYTLVALGMARERWLAAWTRAGLSRRRVVSVRPVTWRSRVLGGAAVRMRREEIREREMFAARAECPGVDIGPDEAAAVLISRWATRAPAVAKVLRGRV